jgi:hypothetical protein
LTGGLVVHHVAMTTLRVRRLAAIDMHGLAGTVLRRRVILAEFIFGAAGCVVLGLLAATRAANPGWRLVGLWLVGIGINYVALALHAVSLSRTGALDAELEGVEVGSELRRYGLLQFWIAMPLLLAVLAVRQARQRP